MVAHNFVSELVWIFGSVAVLGTLFLMLKQPVVLAYIFAGIILGPSIWGVIGQHAYIDQTSELGIVFLLFVIGLNLKLSDLIHLFKKIALLTVSTSVLFAGLTATVLLFFGFSAHEAIIAGCALMFSSTVIGFKLIPTTDLHNKRIGEIMISVLLFQDIMAIMIILLIGSFASDGSAWMLTKQISLTIFTVIIFSIVAFGLVKKLLMKLFFRYDVIQEYIFILSLGWCFVTAETAAAVGLSQAIGAFIGGISLAITPIAPIIAERMKPLREFFLIIFFFTIGSSFNIYALHKVWLPALIIGTLLVLVKPLAFRKAFISIGEPRQRSKELGLRLGQASEFSLLLTVTAQQSNLIGQDMRSLIETATIITFMISTYWVVLTYATPISMDAGHRRD